MKLEEMVCSLEVARQLKELNVKQESLFWWRKYAPKTGETYISAWQISLYKGSTNNYESISAFTASELGEMLPRKIEIPQILSNSVELILKMAKGITDSYLLEYSPNGDYIMTGKPISVDSNEANARAKMLIHLIEEGIIKNE